MNTIHTISRLKQHLLDSVIVSSGLVIGIVGYLGRPVSWLATNF